MTDYLLEAFFEKERWEKAIETGVDKGISEKELRLLCNPEVRLMIYQKMKSGELEVAPPHEAQVPKSDGTMRTVYVCEPIDRILLSIANDLLFDQFPEMIHPSCKSYQHGIGTGKVVQSISAKITEIAGLSKEVGWKADLSKYFDSVPRANIMGLMDTMDIKFGGDSAFIEWLRKLYESDYVFDLEGNLIQKYQSLKQGVATASFFACAMLYDIDEKLSQMNGIYVRYSDDMLFVGEDYKEAMAAMRYDLSVIGLTLNPKKVEAIRSDRWFKFLGFNIKGDKITLSSSRVKKFQKEIEARTIRNRKTTPKKALNSVNRFLYIGDGTYSWATSVLPIVNVKEDLDTLTEFVLDSLRAVKTGKKKIGGLGSVNDLDQCTVLRGRGKNVKANREKTAKEIPGFRSLSCMRNAMLTDRAVYDTLVRQL